MESEKLIEVGFTAARHPATREFLPAVKMYILAEDAGEEDEQKLIDDIGHLLALRIKAYEEGCRDAGVAV